MSSSPVLNPEIPYVGDVEGGLFPGKMVKIQGKVPPEAVRFAINYQLGPNLNPRDDIAIHVSPRFPEGFITRNHIEGMSWGPEENEGPLIIQPGQRFEIIILCEQHCYKIAVNGNHFTEFRHRLPFQKVSHLIIDGDVEVTSIFYEIIPVGPPRSPRDATPVPDVPPVNIGPPPPGGIYPTISPQIPPGGYGPPPDAYGGSGGYNPPRAYGAQPGREKAEEEDAFGGCLDKMGLALGGLVAAGGVAAAMHVINKKKEEQEKDHEKTDASKSESEGGGLGGLGALGAALASSLASNALQGDNRYPQSGYPQQESGGGVLGSILGALGGGGAPQQPAHPPPAADPLGGALGSILGGVFGGGGNSQPSYQPSGGYGGYPPPGGYQPSGGYAPQTGGSDFLSGIGSAIGSSLLSSALDGLGKRGKNSSEDHSPSNYGSHNEPEPSPPPARRPSPPPSGGTKLSAAEISKGLGLDDDVNDD
ncbi:collagen alpha-1(III) chain [Orussus abietinus]|uniref:collagen alpha-1(III) chain n=1 Tax=Orussus abietinus TaxID=222816 RepID=UPI000625B4C3|nr:collagen alpha-1(III) chain [Orussus abietinus]